MTDAYPPPLVELLNPPTGVVALAATHIESGRRWRHNDAVGKPDQAADPRDVLGDSGGGGLDPNERVTVPAEALRVEGTGV